MTIEDWLDAAIGATNTAREEDLTTSTGRCGLETAGPGTLVTFGRGAGTIFLLCDERLVSTAVDWAGDTAAGGGELIAVAGRRTCAEVCVWNTFCWSVFTLRLQSESDPACATATQNGSDTMTRQTFFIEPLS